MKVHTEHYELKGPTAFSKINTSEVKGKRIIRKKVAKIY